MNIKEIKISTTNVFISVLDIAKKSKREYIFSRKFEKRVIFLFVFFKASIS